MHKNFVKSFVLIVLAAGVTGCSAVGSSTTDTASDDYTPEYLLAVIHGDESSESQFAEILDQIQAGGQICDPEPDREHVADVLVGGWQASSQKDSLLEFSQALASVCS